jgi:hypothetical protein
MTVRETPAAGSQQSESKQAAAILSVGHLTPNQCVNEDSIDHVGKPIQLFPHRICPSGAKPIVEGNGKPLLSIDVERGGEPASSEAPLEATRFAPIALPNRRHFGECELN